MFWVVNNIYCYRGVVAAACADGIVGDKLVSVSKLNNDDTGREGKQYLASRQ